MSNQTSDNNKTNSEEYASSLLPYALYDGGVSVYEQSSLEYIGSRGLWYI